MSLIDKKLWKNFDWPLFALIYFRWHNKSIDQFFLRIVGWILILAGISSIACINMTEIWNGPMIGPGGYVGVTLVYFLNSYFSSTGKRTSSNRN